MERKSIPMRDGIWPVLDGNRVRYICLACTKRFLHESDARMCAESCGGKHLGEKWQQQLLRISRLRPVFSERSLPNTSGESDLQAVHENESIQDFIQETEVTSPSPSYQPPKLFEDTQGDEGGVAKSAQENVLTREPGQKPFVRDNAKYVCSVCKQDFFTRVEVEKCFESHPIREV